MFKKYVLIPYVHDDTSYLPVRVFEKNWNKVFGYITYGFGVDQVYLYCDERGRVVVTNLHHIRESKHYETST